MNTLRLAKEYEVKNAQDGDDVAADCANLAQATFLYEGSHYYCKVVKIDI